MHFKYFIYKNTYTRARVYILFIYVFIYDIYAFKNTKYFIYLFNFINIYKKTILMIHICITTSCDFRLVISIIIYIYVYLL